MTTASVVGSTGLVGSNILSTLQAHPVFSKIYAYARRDLNTPLITELKSTDTSTWPSLYPSDSQVFFSALGTTRAQAGGLENQRKIDLDLNLDLAKAAKAAGTKVYVLISSAGATSKSFIPYPKMKGELEDAVKALDFDHCIIVRPGLLVGPRTQSRLAEGIVQAIAKGAGAIHRSAKDFWAQDAEVVARAAVAASAMVLDGSEKSKVWLIEQADIVRLGRTEWKS